MIAAYGRCDDEVALPYQPLVAALGELVTRAPTGLLGEYAREFGGELSRFVPALARRLPWLPPPQTADAETERHLFFDAAAGLLGHLTRERPLLLVVDDLHWAERETLRLLRYLVESVEGRPVLVVLAYRGAEVGIDTPLADLLGLMRRREDVTVLSLAGLSGAEAVPLVELLTGRTGSDARHLAERVAEETGGNPLFTLELLRHLVEQREGGDGFDDVAVLPLPDSVRDVVERRVARLGPADDGAPAAGRRRRDVVRPRRPRLDGGRRRRRGPRHAGTGPAGPPRRGDGRQRPVLVHARAGGSHVLSRASRRPAWNVSTSGSPRRSRSCTERSPART